MKLFPIVCPCGERLQLLNFDCDGTAVIGCPEHGGKWFIGSQVVIDKKKTQTYLA